MSRVYTPAGMTPQEIADYNNSLEAKALLQRMREIRKRRREEFWADERARETSRNEPELPAKQ